MAIVCPTDLPGRTLGDRTPLRAVRAPGLLLARRDVRGSLLLAVQLGVALANRALMCFRGVARWLIGADVPGRTRRPWRGDVVAFDFDGTLCDSMRAIQQAINEMAPRMGFPAVDEARYLEFRTMSLRQIQRALGLSVWQLATLGRHARRALWQRMDTLRPVAGVAEALRTLHAGGYRLAIVSSNHRRNVEAFLRANDLECFDEIVTYQGPGSGLWRKQRQLRALMAGLGSEARYVYVCDEIRDVEAARAVGMPVIAVGWGANTAEALAAAGPTACIHAAEELAPAVRTVLSAAARGAARPPV